MAAHAGEEAQREGDLQCEKCRNMVHVMRGSRIPKCPKCGNETFGEQMMSQQGKQRS